MQLRYKPSSFQTDALWLHLCDLLIYLSLSTSLQHSTMKFPNSGSQLHPTDTFITLPGASRAPSHDGMKKYWREIRKKKDKLPLCIGSMVHLIWCGVRDVQRLLQKDAHNSHKLLLTLHLPIQESSPNPNQLAAGLCLCITCNIKLCFLPGLGMLSKEQQGS